MMILTALLISTSLLLLSCGVTPSQPGEDGPPSGITMTIPPYDILRHGFDLEGVWANELGSIRVGEKGMAFLATADGRYVLPTLAKDQLTDVWAVTDGTIFITTEKEENDSSSMVMWSRELRWHSFPSTAPFHAVTGTFTGGGSYPVFTIKSNVIHRFDGDEWSPLKVTPLHESLDIWAYDSESLYIAATNGVTFRNNNGSYTWVHTGGSFDGISAVSLDSMMVIRELDGAWDIMMRSMIGFNPVFNSAAPLKDLCWVEQDYAIAVGGNGTTVEYDGLGWIKRSVDPPVNFKAVAAWKESGQRCAVAVGDSGGVFTLTGNQWAGVSSPKITCTELMGVSPSLMFALHDGHLMKYDGDWHKQPPAGTLQLHDFFCLDEDTVWAVGKQDIDTFFARYDGTSWYTQWISSMEDAHDIWAADNHNVFIACDYGTVYSSAGFWAPMTVVQPVQHLRGIWGASATSVYVVGDNGTISHWDGSVWTRMTSGTSSNLHAVWGSSDQNVVAVSNDGTVLRFDGNTWRSMAAGLTPDSNPMVWCGGADNIWVGTSKGKMVHFNGAGWEPRDTQLGDFIHTGMWGMGKDLFIIAENDLLLRYQPPPVDMSMIRFW